MRPRATRHVWSLWIIVAFAPCANAQEAPAGRLTEDLVYTRVADQELRLDIMTPAQGEGPFPVVMVIHGGAWRGGNKKDVRPFMERLALKGYASVSPQYRLCPQHTAPAQIHDVKAAVRWVRNNASEHQLQPDRMGALGLSAGAHLALMLGVTSPDDGLEGEPLGSDPVSTRLQAVVNYFGPTDLAAPDIPEVAQGLLRDFLGGSPAEKADLCRQASPITFVSKDDPPILTFQGTKDPLVPHTQATRLADAMTAAGVPGRVELLIGAGHGWGMTEMLRTVDQAILFLDQHIKR
jgi:acetyl esterase/lipase